MNKLYDVDDIYRTLKEIRKKKRLTQVELGKIMGVERSVISKIETGNRGNSLQTLVKYSESLGITLRFKITTCR